jgi:ClpA/ClpB-like protein
MFERYDESARRAIFYAAKEARAGSAYVEPEHLLLGVMRASEPAASSALELYGLEQELRAGRATSGQAAPSTADIPLANASKRIVAYAAEEAARLNSWEIHCGHLLLGILREADGVAARFLVEHGIDLEKARETVVRLPRREGDAVPPRLAETPWGRKVRRRIWIESALQLALLVAFVWTLATSDLGARWLLIIAAVWLVALAGWVFRARSFSFVFRHHESRRAVILAYAFSMLYQLFVYGWIVVLAVGIYRQVGK